MRTQQQSERSHDRDPGGDRVRTVTLEQRRGRTKRRRRTGTENHRYRLALRPRFVHHRQKFDRLIDTDSHIPLERWEAVCARIMFSRPGKRCLADLLRLIAWHQGTRSHTHRRSSPPSPVPDCLGIHGRRPRWAAKNQGYSVFRCLLNGTLCFPEPSSRAT